MWQLGAEYWRQGQHCSTTDTGTAVAQALDRWPHTQLHKCMKRTSAARQKQTAKVSQTSAKGIGQHCPADVQGQNVGCSCASGHGHVRTVDLPGFMSLVLQIRREEEAPTTQACTQINTKYWLNLTDDLTDRVSTDGSRATVVR